MSKTKSSSKRKTFSVGDEKISLGEGGETHQIAGDDVPILTTQQGIPVADDQNSLRIGARGPTALEDFPLSRKDFPFRP